ncbi:MAG: hypothetical protein EBU90_23410 [Proteobacteria bacterium]|nr:hypothetical protein [Pseudomonadota bacterium]NBP16425.1 hypothetical protein [bacterium]
MDDPVVKIADTFDGYLLSTILDSKLSFAEVSAVILARLTLASKECLAEDQFSYMLSVAQQKLQEKTPDNDRIFH